MKNICIKFDTDWKLFRHRNDDTFSFTPAKRLPNDRIIELLRYKLLGVSLLRRSEKPLKKSFNSFGKKHSFSIRTYKKSCVQLWSTKQNFPTLIRCDNEKNVRFINLIWTVKFILYEYNEKFNSNVVYNVRKVIFCNALKQSLSKILFREHAWSRVFPSVKFFDDFMTKYELTHRLTNFLIDMA